MHRLSVWVTLILFGLAAAGAALLERDRVAWGPGEHGPAQALRVGYAIEAPYVYLDAEGRVSGEAPEVLRATLQRLGQPEPIWVHHEFPTLIPALLSGRIDVIAAGMFITPERNRVVAFTRPTARVGTGLLVARGNPHGLHSLPDLARHGDLRLAVIDTSVEQQQALAADLAPERLQRLPDALSGIAAVQTGTAGAFALSAPSLRWLLHRGHAKGVEMADPFAVPDGQAQPGLPAFALRRGDPLRERLDRALADWLGSAEHRTIAARHGFSAAELPASASSGRTEVVQ